MRKQVAIHCENCGEYIGHGERWPGDMDHCGKAECAREVQSMHQAARDERILAAEDDDYGRY